MADGHGRADVATFRDPVDGTRWRVDLEFLASSWRCIWGAGCEGILDRPAADLGQGCCSLGAELLDDDEARRIVALAATLDPAVFENHEVARVGGVLDATRRHTRVVDGACVFSNPPEFPGGAGCALHIAAIADDESITDWKPAVCWQLPLKVERDGDDAVLRRRRREDWGPGGRSMAWWCFDEPEPYTGAAPVAESMAEELEALVGPEVAVAIRARIADD